LGEILWRLSREKKILVILSADFSHYKNSVEAQADDKKTIEIINNFIFNKITEAEIDTRPFIGCNEICRIIRSFF
jgi:AmmeMemoRadiSam system protein B